MRFLVPSGLTKSDLIRLSLILMFFFFASFFLSIIFFCYQLLFLFLFLFSSSSSLPTQEPLLSQKIISTDSAKAVFGSIQVIQQTCHLLSAQLEERLGNWYSAGQRIGDIFSKIVKMLKIYTDYVNNYDTSLDEVARLRKTNKFCDFFYIFCCVVLFSLF